MTLHQGFQSRGRPRRLVLQPLEDEQSYCTSSGQGRGERAGSAEQTAEGSETSHTEGLERSGGAAEASRQSGKGCSEEGRRGSPEP